ncbi:MAG: DJ-1/PfpI family protein [Oscillospiraceae bacterium]|nr:DJ-1/PfpI family protein [Oscillospiraceae bacterium]
MIYVFLANGFEEVEALTPADLLRRAGKDLQLVGVTGKTVTGSHGIKVECDITAGEIVLGGDLEMIVLPGGMPGTLNLEKSEAVQTAVDFCYDRRIPIGAICAAPSILGHKGLLDGREAIAYPGFETQLTGAKISQHSVAQDEFIITAQGAGAAAVFGLKLVETLCDAGVSQKIADSVCYPVH